MTKLENESRLAIIVSLEIMKSYEGTLDAVSSLTPMIEIRNNLYRTMNLLERTLQKLDEEKRKYDMELAEAKEKEEKLKAMKEKIDFINSDPDAIKFYNQGIPPTYSTGINDCLTCGYGKLDEWGFWEFPLILIKE